MSSSSAPKKRRQRSFIDARRAEQQAKRPRQRAKVGADATPRASERPSSGLLRDAMGRTYWYAKKANAHQDPSGGIWLAFQSPKPTERLQHAVTTGSLIRLEAVKANEVMQATGIIETYGYLGPTQRYGLVRVSGLSARMVQWMQGIGV